MILADRFLALRTIFLWTGTTITIFDSLERFPLSKHDSKINFRGSQIESLHIFTIWTLIILFTWALLRHQFKNKLLIVIHFLFAFFVGIVGSSLLYFKIERTLLDKDIVKTCLAFFEINNILSLVYWRNVRTFYYLSRSLTLTSKNLLDKQVWHFLLVILIKELNLLREIKTGSETGEVYYSREKICMLEFYLRWMILLFFQNGTQSLHVIISWGN